MDGRDLSPFLNKWRAFDSFHESANFPSLKDLLKRIDNRIEISFENIQLLMASGPVALFGFSNLIKVSISPALQEISERRFCVFARKGGS